MNIFPFLATIVIYFFAFMEWDPPKHAAYIKFGLDLGELEDQLKELKRKISNQTNTSKGFDKKDLKRIETIIDKVKEAHTKYDSKAQPEIEKSTSIEQPVGEVKNDIDSFYRKNHYSSDATSALINNVEHIWEEQIRLIVNRVIDEN